MAPSMGAEDFSFMLQIKPGAYLRIGQGGGGGCFLHSSRYDFNDDILPLGARCWRRWPSGRCRPSTPHQGADTMKI